LQRAVGAGAPIGQSVGVTWLDDALGAVGPRLGFARRGSSRGYAAAACHAHGVTRIEN
jgi:hypothetical protein